MDYLTTAIKKCHEEKSKILDLDSTNLKQIPPEVFSLTHIQELKLCDNKLSEIPENIIKLENLKSLELKNNQLKELPKSISSLPLTRLILSDNCFNNIPSSIGENIEELDLSKNKIDTVSLGKGHRLCHLNLSYNHLYSVRDELNELTNLETLNLSCNFLYEFLPCSNKLENLRALLLNFNQLESVPKEIYLLKNLEVLGIRNNRIKKGDIVLSQLKLKESTKIDDNNNFSKF